MIFKPILAGANPKDRLFAGLGALAGITATFLCCAILLRGHPMLPLLVAPMGASAVLVFAVPASPLAQPWPVIGGNVLSAVVGVSAARLVPSLPIAVGVAVGGAILVMSLCRCLHPPGGAAALLAVIGGPAVTAAGYGFALAPVGINAVVLTLAGLLYHRFSGHSYPHRPVPAPAASPATDPLHREDIDAALAEMGDAFDIDPDDLDALLRRAEHHAARRRRAP